MVMKQMINTAGLWVNAVPYWVSIWWVCLLDVMRWHSTEVSLLTQCLLGQSNLLCPTCLHIWLQTKIFVECMYMCISVSVCG